VTINFRKVFAISLLSSLLLAFPAEATPKVFKNCTEMNKVYPGGVAKVGAVNQGGATKYEPKYDNALYEANKKSDRDGDGIACEK
jgi:Excalibur calcium-binding domain